MTTNIALDLVSLFSLLATAVLLGHSYPLAALQERKLAPLIFGLGLGAALGWGLSALGLVMAGAGILSAAQYQSLSATLGMIRTTSWVSLATAGYLFWDIWSAVKVSSGLGGARSSYELVLRELSVPAILEQGLPGLDRIPERARSMLRMAGLERLDSPGARWVLACAICFPLAPAAVYYLVARMIARLARRDLLLSLQAQMELSSPPTPQVVERTNQYGLPELARNPEYRGPGAVL